jgi:hypothetical protein
MTVVLETILARVKVIAKIVQSRQESCKYFKDAVMWKSEFIGVHGQVNDRGSSALQDFEGTRFICTLFIK